GLFEDGHDLAIGKAGGFHRISFKSNNLEILLLTQVKGRGYYRVLALAYLMTESKQELRTWPKQWLEALKVKFPKETRQLALRSGNGLRELLIQENDFEQAVKTCNDGLLVSHHVTLGQLKVTAERFISDVIDPLEDQVGR
ncbi:hypothetical protein, partial [Polynucleobacter sp. AM-25C3]|uniref:hypothetical protein n=1 Tax=Polynucleobacter sp. AM-25C3 TaxID=1855569 RepID=UPI001C0CB29A